jgi:hypothetical protein
MEYAKFLQDIVKEMAKEVKHTCSGGIKQRAEDIDQFIKKVLDFPICQHLLIHVYCIIILPDLDHVLLM